MNNASLNNHNHQLYVENIILDRARLEKTLDRPVLDRPDASKYWEKIDELFYRTLGYAERSFKVNLYINMLIVSVGCALVLYSVSYGWLKGLDVYSAALGALGVLSIVNNFYLAPQRKIQKTMGDLTQVQIFYRTYCAQWENIMDWAKENNDMTLEQLEALNKQLEDRSSAAIEKIEVPELKRSEVFHNLFK